jgi:RecA/RadA recombinase
MAKKKKSIDEIVQGVESDLKVELPVFDREFQFIDSGITLLNLQLTDRHDCGYPLGTMVNLIGDSNTAKSLMLMTLMAEALIDKRFDAYDLIYEDLESALFFPMEQMFGKNISRIQVKHAMPRFMEDWHSDVIQCTKKPCITGIDSWDTLVAKDDMKKAIDGEYTTTGWKTAKALLSAAVWPMIMGQIWNSQSLMFVISQTRDNIGVTFGAAKKRSGGNALRFFSSCEIWLANAGVTEKTVRGQKRKTGHNVLIRVARTRITGKQRTVEIQVNNDIGVDNTSSNVAWLMKEKFWGKDGDHVLLGTDHERFGFDPDAKLTVPALVKAIEGGKHQALLAQITGECWQELEREIATPRKSKYA